MIIKRTFTRPSVDVKWLNMDDAAYAAFANALTSIAGVTITPTVSTDGLTRDVEITISDAAHSEYMDCLAKNQTVIDAESARRTAVGITSTLQVI
jgi:hypothetical protein